MFHAGSMQPFCPFVLHLHRLDCFSDSSVSCVARQMPVPPDEMADDAFP